MTRQMTRWLTIREAVEFTGKSESTIRRLTRRLTSHDQVKRERAGNGYTYKLNASFLRKKYGLEPTGTDRRADPTTDPAETPTTNQGLLDTLTRQLEAKDRHIDQLLERNRELNNIVMALRNDNQQLLLTSGLTSQVTSQERAQEAGPGEQVPSHDQANDQAGDDLGFISFIKWIGKKAVEPFRVGPS